MTPFEKFQRNLRNFEIKIEFTIDQLPPDLQQRLERNRRFNDALYQSLDEHMERVARGFNPRMN